MDNHRLIAPVSGSCAPRALVAFARCLRLLPRGRQHAAHLFSRYLQHQEPFVTFFGDPPTAFTIDLNDLVCRYLFLEGTWEPPASVTWMAMLRPGQVVCDIGAHYGYFTLLAAQRVQPSGRVIAFEPAPGIRTRLQANLALNGNTSVTVEPLAIGAGPGTALLDTTDSTNTGRAHVVRSVTADSNKEVSTVAVTALDQYCREKGIQHVDLIKMDIEGSEADALEGMKDGLASGKYPRLLVEIHPGPLRALGKDASVLIQSLLSRGFSCWTLPKRMPGPWGHLHPRYTPGLLTAFDGSILESHSHFLFLGKGIPLPS